ncbi:MAG: hypothetical protein AAFZ15_32175 [Bacteroidota bacterium]
MKKYALFFVGFLNVLMLYAQEGQLRNCIVISHQVNPILFCRSGTSTSVDILLDVNCDLSDLNGIDIRIEYFAENGKWIWVATKSLSSNFIKYRGTGLKIETNQKYRFLAYSKNTNIKFNEVPESTYEVYSFYVKKICK